MNEEISNFVAEDIPDITFANQILDILEQRYPDSIFRLSYNESTFGITINSDVKMTEDERRLLYARAAAFAEGLISVLLLP